MVFPAISQEYQSHFPPEEFQQRREKVYDYIGKDAVAVIQGAVDPGGFQQLRQSNIFFYLCGVENDNSYLLVDGRDRTTTLFLSDNNPHGWERVLSLDDPEKVVHLTGVDRVLHNKELKDINAKFIYTAFSPAQGTAQSKHEIIASNRKKSQDYWDGRPSREQHFIALLRTRNHRSEIKDLSPLIEKMRSIKSPLEIELMRISGEFT